MHCCAPADAGEAAGGDAHMEPVDSEEEGSDEMEREGGEGEGGITEHNITVTMEFSNLPRVQVRGADVLIGFPGRSRLLRRRRRQGKS